MNAKKQAFKYDEDTVKLFKKFYETLSKAGVSKIIIKKDKHDEH
jgi:hypothetical protein